ncbi:hypothetical protein QE152_g8251 [Popillia japonica]|uniref:Uncharacterized protein n=1 Tax=Popillia japonica TaxID=7064 RepID=A0AAW1MDG2_POPJA
MTARKCITPSAFRSPTNSWRITINFCAMNVIKRIQATRALWNDQFLCHECYKEDPSDESTLEDLGYAEENTAKDADDITQGSNLEDTELTMQEYSRNDEDYVMKEDTVESGKSAEVDEIEE